jgi:hypothetical protein
MTAIDSDTLLQPPRRAPSASLHPVNATAPRTLAQLIRNLVCAADDRTLKPLSPGDVGTLCQTKALLVVVIHCYALQIYGSRDVAKIVARYPGFPALSRDEVPDAQAIRQIRAANREVIQRCLAAALHFRAQQKISSGILTRVNCLHLAEEAGRRMIMAAFIDSMEPDCGRAMEPAIEVPYLFANRREQAH